MKQIYLFKNSLFLVVFMLCSHAYSQSVSGTVSDASGPLPGANVIVIGTSNGAITDFDGNYTVNNVAEDAVLSISYVGYVTQAINVDGRSTINITLVEDASRLEEVVVMGYTTQTRGDLTGAVSSIDMDEALKAPVVNAAEALQGRATGVTVVSSGQPGGSPKITIRGFGSSNNTNPLYVIDGVQTDDPSVLNNINSSDIDQMNVLKDGAAAIYGARASNGVVIITTKSGGYNMNKAIFSVDAYTGVSEAMNVPDLLSAEQHGQMIWESLANDGAVITHPQYGSGSSPVVPSSLQGVDVPTTVRPGGTDWIDTILQSAMTQNVSLSLQNGTSSGKYFMSASYLNREGVLKYTGFKRGSTRLNSEFKIKDKIKVGEHLNVSFSNTKSGSGEALENALRNNPLIPAYDDNGNLAGTYSNSIGLGNARSALGSLARTNDNYNKSLTVFGDVYMAADLYEGLTFKTTLSGRMQSYNGRSFTYLDPEHSEPISTNTLYESDFNSYEWSWSNTLNYSKDFGDHSFNALVGIEALETSQKGKSVSRSGYLFETPDFYLLSNGSGVANVGYAYDGKSTLYSLFGTTNYSYKGKYLATATVRNDKSSRFSGDNKSDIFPSFSAGWVISKEDFFQ